MPWHLVLLAAGGETDPGSASVGSIVGAVLNYGLLGIITVVFALLLYKGWRLMPPAREDEIRKEARADLLARIEQLLADADQGHRDKAEITQQRDDAQQFTQSNLVPLLIQFTGATNALIPLLQDLVRHREAGELDSRRRNR